MSLTSYIKVIVSISFDNFAYISAILGPILTRLDHNDGMADGDKQCLIIWLMTMQVKITIYKNRSCSAIIRMILFRNECREHSKKSKDSIIFYWLIQFAVVGNLSHFEQMPRLICLDSRGCTVELLLLGLHSLSLEGVCRRQRFKRLFLFTNEPIG